MSGRVTRCHSCSFAAGFLGGGSLPADLRFGGLLASFHLRVKVLANLRLCGGLLLASLGLLGLSSVTSGAAAGLLPLLAWCKRG